MAEVTSVTLLYTANLKGDLHLLPRLFALIQQQRRVAAGPVMLLDLGDTCSLDAWICHATHGRAPFMVLDAMGYDAALIGGPEQVPIPPAALRRLRETLLMPVLLWNTTARLTKKGITLALASGDAVLSPDIPGCRIDRAARTLPDEHAPQVVLGDVPQGCLARVDLAWPQWTVQNAHLVALTAEAKPDPGVAAVVDLIEGEARYYAQQGGVLP